MKEQHLPQGFRFHGLHCGLKDDPADLDLSLIHSDVEARAAGVFTRSHIPGEPVKLAKERLKKGRLQTLVVNSRYSNVATGEVGRQQALNICRLVAASMGQAPDSVLISSTGIIGRPYPEGVIDRSIPTLIEGLSHSEEGLWHAAQGIMTTDTIPKAFSARVDGCNIVVLAKGSGMIAPNMATMLAFICTDAELEGDLQAMLQRVVDQSFNAISIDFDTSTSDSCFLMANGTGGKVDLERFEETLTALCQEVSEALVLDGEGVDTLIDCTVYGGIDVAMSRAVAHAVINSPLVKTMVTGADPNWGRLIMAIGKTEDPRLAGVTPSIHICGHQVLEEGVPVVHDLEAISTQMRESDRVSIDIDLHFGQAPCRAFGGNLTADYVSINADYTT